jgi:hypothetical protein
MPNETNTALAQLTQLQAQLEANPPSRPEEIKEIDKQTAASYGDSDHPYPKIAKQVVENSEFNGRVANCYFKKVLEIEGIPWDPLQHSMLKLGLAIAYQKVLGENKGAQPSNAQIEAIHQSVFDKHGVPYKAWLPMVFNNYMAPGAFFLGKDSNSQHDPVFTVDNSNILLNSSTQPGTPAHRDVAYCSYILISQGVLSQTIAENPGEFVEFCVEAGRNLQGDLSELETSKLAELGAGLLARGAWHGCFAAIEHPPQLESLQMSNLEWLTTEPGMAHGRWLAYKGQTPETRCNAALSISRTLQRLFPNLAIAEEAKVAFNNVYHQVLPSDFLDFINTEGKSPLPNREQLFPTITSPGCRVDGFREVEPVIPTTVFPAESASSLTACSPDVGLPFIEQYRRQVASALTPPLERLPITEPQTAGFSSPFARQMLGVSSSTLELPQSAIFPTLSTIEPPANRDIPGIGTPMSFFQPSWPSLLG